jgi:hypothetical protein
MVGNVTVGIDWVRISKGKPSLHEAAPTAVNLTVVD